MRRLIALWLIIGLSSPVMSEDRSADAYPIKTQSNVGQSIDLIGVFRRLEGQGRKAGWPRQWCARGLNYVMSRANVAGTGSDMARSFLAWGRPVASPMRGDIVIMSRGRCRTCGHVGVIDSANSPHIMVWSANHGGRFALAQYPMSRVIGYRRK